MTDAEAYERGFARLSAHTVTALLDRAGVPARHDGPGARTRVLDAGCGSGVVTAGALARGARVTAFDSDAAMAGLAARRHPEAEVLVARLPRLPFADGTFDAVAGNFIINHAPDTAAALRELRRVLRPGGTAALTWWKSSEMTATGVISDAVEAAGAPFGTPPRPLAASAGPGRFAALMRASGFTGVAVETLRWRHPFDPDGWLADVVAAGGPRFGPIAAQPASTRARIRAAYIRLAAPYAREGFPVCAHLAHGTTT
ncbi:class I SAM-dependent methyltransferase [Nonomuraea sp. SBT364]|uniref:class I SAM-dependent methyltransferase n=1 Tax=Nonomuraea sp. SBT364 TaxID=1580530 RepID=UPI0018CDF89A|nr:class I SAM-dependent methyltransferase [Nonomuraea sp. SBT364]